MFRKRLSYKSKSVLIFYSPVAQKHLVSQLVKNMRTRGLLIDAFNVTDWTWCDKGSLPLLYVFLRSFLNYKYSGIIIRKLFNTNLLLYLSKRYQLIDIHYFSKSYIKFLNRVNQRYKITIWGSDFYRESKQNNICKRAYYEKASVIQVASEKIRDDVLKYDSSLVNKIAIAHFGIDLFDEIDKQRNSCEYLIDTVLRKDKIVVTCGYNGTVGQQHKLIFDSIRALDYKIKQKILLYVPATYGLTSSYRKDLIAVLDSLSVDYYFFEHRLSEKQLALLRLETDVAVNIQITDALSSSLQEHLYAGSVLIVGDWLPYDILKDNGLFFIQTSVKELSCTISNVVCDICSYRGKTLSNHNILKNFSSWTAVTENLFSIYENALTK